MIPAACRPTAIGSRVAAVTCIASLWLMAIPSCGHYGPPVRALDVPAAAANPPDEEEETRKRRETNP